LPVHKVYVFADHIIESFIHSAFSYL
jgi:hypothetical protein